MNDKEDAFLVTLRATFRIEANEHLQTIATGLLELEKAPAADGHRRLIETVFRAAHSLKGAARSVNFGEIELICQSLEDTFASWKRGDTAPSSFALDAAHRSLDGIGRLVAAETRRAPDGPPSSPSSHPASRSVSATAPPTAEPTVVETSGSAETVRISVDKLDARLLQAEEMLAAKLAAGQRTSDLREFAERFGAWTKELASVQPDVRALRQTLEHPERAASLPPELARLVEFFEWNHDFLRSLESRTAALCRTAEQDRLVIGRLVDDLLEDSKKLLMLPLSTLGAVFPKMVRDLCRDQGKEADFTLRGDEIEMDKRIIEEMKDPVIHLLRNCVDHGVEPPEQRRRLGKPPRAAISLSVSPLDGDKVELLVSDDGSGIDVKRLKESAVRHGIIQREEAERLGEAEALDLIFRADVSTSPIITQISGRGLGLAIVREKAEKLGGRVFVESRPDAGTSIRITLPVALATFRGILVESEERLFVVPTASVERVSRFKDEDVQTVEGRETLSIDRRATALVRLTDVLELPACERKNERPAYRSVAVLGTGDQRVAFEVDAVLDEQEVLVKRFGKPLSRVRNISGATVLGNGRLAPVLNVADLLRSARKQGGVRRDSVRSKPAETGAGSILVAEDSITSRMLLKGILESAGYRVRTAVDGMDAFTALRSERFDLVVSDVEMPRMNGFDLTARIRADRKLAELPVVLVTAMETREDREHGIDVGANAYLVKSSFDQSNLLEAVRRLI